MIAKQREILVSTQISTANSCPACGNIRVDHSSRGDEVWCCAGCGHRWRTAVSDASAHRKYYDNLGGRNLLESPDHERKMRDRLRTLAPLLCNGQSILEVGCAEGDLGRRIKAMHALEYIGVELSSDADLARTCLDRVHRVPVSTIPQRTFDLILAFHVLEHIPDIGAELRQWRRLLTVDGRLVIEVPNQAGHVLLSRDGNPEHLHHFTTASLAALLHRSGLAIIAMTTGHFESAVYSDSIRVTAGILPDDMARYRRLLDRFRAVLPTPFIVYGLGGDFRNYIAPLLADLPVAGLVDSDRKRHGEPIGGKLIESYDPQRFLGLRVLIGSLSRQAEIIADLKRLEVPQELIVTLGDIYG